MVQWYSTGGAIVHPIYMHDSLGPSDPKTQTDILIGSAVFAQLTVECPYTLLWLAPFRPRNCPFLWENMDPHLIRGFLAQPEPTTQTASRSVQPFLQDLRL